MKLPGDCLVCGLAVQKTTNGISGGNGCALYAIWTSRSEWAPLRLDAVLQPFLNYQAKKASTNSFEHIHGNVVDLKQSGLLSLKIRSQKGGGRLAAHPLRIGPENRSVFSTAGNYCTALMPPSLLERKVFGAVKCLHIDEVLALLRAINRQPELSPSSG
jgi:hypothetical protein